MFLNGLYSIETSGKLILPVAPNETSTESGFPCITLAESPKMR